MFRSMRIAGQTRLFSSGKPLQDSPIAKSFYRPIDFSHDLAKTESQTQAAETSFEYKPQTLSNEEIVSSTARPVPLNVELNFHEPIKHKPTHKHLVAEISFKGYAYHKMDFFGNFALRAAFFLGIPVAGPTPIKTRKELWTVNKSFFAQGKTKENFTRHTHGRFFRVYDTHSDVLDLYLALLHKYSVYGIGIKAKVHQREGLSLSSEMDKVNIQDMAQEHYPIDPVAARVQELLADPSFKRYFQEDIEIIEKEVAGGETVEGVPVEEVEAAEVAEESTAASASAKESASETAKTAAKAT